MWVELCFMSFKGSLPLLKLMNFQKSSLLSAILLHLLSLTNSSVTSESKHFHPMQSRRECHCFLRAPTSDSYPAEVLAVKRWEETKKRRLTTVWGLRNPQHLLCAAVDWARVRTTAGDASAAVESAMVS